MAVFSHDEYYPQLENSACNFGPYSLPFGQVAGLLKRQKDRDVAVNEFMKMLLRALVKETFELIKNYCRISSQRDVFETQPFYSSARLIGNGLSHDLKLVITKKDRELLPVHWKKKTITEAMNGNQLELSFFGYEEAWELFQEIQAFARTSLR